MAMANATGTAMATATTTAPPPHHHACAVQFHCELNWIERLWGASKLYARNHCMYTLAGLRETIPISLSQDLSDLPEHMVSQVDVPVAPLFLQRRWARISWQYMLQYCY